MKKPLKFYQTLNQAPRSAKEKHGQHRRAGASAHSHSIVGADYSSGGSDQSGTITIATLGGPPTVPYAGVRTGELIGHRLWWVVPENGELHLSSLAHRRLWVPGETIIGDLNEMVCGIIRAIWGGVYSFFNAADAHAEMIAAVAELDDLRKRRTSGWIISGWSPYYEAIAVVSGTIKMWGDVIEHERGWRSEFAKLASIDAVHGAEGGTAEILASLQAKYGVALSRPNRT